jgi:hypothetical protein
LYHPRVTLDVPETNTLLGVFDEHLTQEITKKIVNFLILEAIVVTIRVRVLAFVERGGRRRSRRVNWLETPAWNVHVIARYLLEHLELVFGQEGDTSIDKAVESYSEGPDVNLLRDLGLLLVRVRVTKLGCEEGRSADSFGEFQIVVKVASLGFGNSLVILAVPRRSAEVWDAKVGYFDAVVPGPEKIGGFDISMHDTLIVEIFEAEDSISKSVTSLF